MFRKFYNYFLWDKNVISWCSEFQKDAVNKTDVVVTTYLIYSKQWNCRIFLWAHMLQFSTSLQRSNVWKKKSDHGLHILPLNLFQKQILLTCLCILKKVILTSSFKWKNLCGEGSWVYSERVCAWDRILIS